MPGIVLEIRRKCKVCGKVFIAKTLDSQFCCKGCGDVFSKRQLDAKKREETLSRIILQIPDAREYISVKQAVAIFGVERDTIYRLIRKGRIPAINLGTRLTRIKREDLEKLIPTRDAIKAEKAKPYPSYTISNLRIAIQLERSARSITSTIVPYGPMFVNTLSHQDI